MTSGLRLRNAEDALLASRRARPSDDSIEDAFRSRTEPDLDTIAPPSADRLRLSCPSGGILEPEHGDAGA